MTQQSGSEFLKQFIEGRNFKITTPPTERDLSKEDREDKHEIKMSLRELTFKSSGSKDFINTNSILNNVDIDLPECPNCKAKRKEKIGRLIRNRKVACACGKTNFIIKQEG